MKPETGGRGTDRAFRERKERPMRKRMRWQVALVLVLFGAETRAGNLNVQGDLTVASNMTAQSITLGGDARTSWPTDHTAGGVTNLSAPVLDFNHVTGFCRYTMTTNTTWVFTNHVAGRQVFLQITQDEVGGWLNTWPANLLWSGQPPIVSGARNRFNLFRILDDGQYWLAEAAGVFRPPCGTNCGAALAFDAEQNYVEASLDCTYTELTVECWYRGNGDRSNAYCPFISTSHDDSESGGGAFSFGFKGDSESIYYYVGGEGAEANWPSSGVHQELLIANLPMEPFDGQWHHYAVVRRSNGTLTLYIDGSAISTISCSASQKSNEAVARLAYQYTHGGSYLGGTIDEVRVSSTARYTSNFAPTDGYLVDSDTIAYWKLDEGTGTSITDETLVNSGTLIGDPVPTWVDGY